VIKTLFLTTKSDFIGSAASSLCLVHCVVTPFLFVAHTGHFHEHHTLNEKLQVVEIAEAFIYVPSIALVILHVYNRKYCQCIDEDCCLNNTTIQS